MTTLSYLDKADILFCKKPAYLESIFPEIRSHIKEDGYCIVQMWDLTEAPLLALQNKLGQCQLHIRSGKNGIVTIAPNTQPSHRLDETLYFSGSTREHPPHTDGAYLNGFLQKNGAFQRIEPPAMVLLQCVQATRNGGTTLLIDAQPVLHDLLTRHPNMAKILMRPGCVSFCRDDHMAVDLPVYERLSAERWRIRFRSDEALYSAEWAVMAIQHLYDHYLTNDKYQQKIVLEEGQILVVDNFRMLHGREAFSTTEKLNRFFRRTWVQDNSHTRVLYNFRSSFRTCRAFERYAAYGNLKEPSAQENYLHLDLGIRIPEHLLTTTTQPMPHAFPVAA